MRDSNTNKLGLRELITGQWPSGEGDAIREDVHILMISQHL